MSSRHSASQWYTTTGPRLRCKADGCTWQSDQGLTLRAQREQHRQHRRAMGEDVKGLLKLDQHERLHVLRQVHQELPGAIGATNLDVICRCCQEPWPCLHRRILEGDPVAAVHLLERYDNDDEEEPFRSRD